MMITVGATIRGKYRVERILGQGGMGTVVGAHHFALDQMVAIKFLHQSMLQHPSIVERFAREARAASRIRSDHVARVLDVDTLDDGTPFMVMEYLEGRDLSGVRRSGHPLPVPLAVTYVLEACEAIAEAHRVGIVHRDLKPANLFVEARGETKTRVKVLDFGISKVSGSDADVGMTATSTVIGSAEYMSPEQMLSAKDVDGRTDIWALGVTLYELLTARVPFRGDTMPQVCGAILQTEPPAPSSLRPEIPSGLDNVILGCLQKDRQRRTATVTDLIRALEPFAASRASLLPNAMATAITPPPGPPATVLVGGSASAGSLADSGPGFTVQAAGPPFTAAPVASTRAPIPPLRGNRTALILSASALALAGAVGLMVHFSTRSEDPAKKERSHATTSAPSPKPDASPSPVSSGGANPTASSITEAASAIASVAPASSTTAVAPPPPTTAKTTVTPSPPPRAANCNPPFIIDAAGFKHAKPECL